MSATSPAAAAENLPAEPNLHRLGVTMSDAWMVSEPMTWSEICERFPDQWVALVTLDWADDHDEPFRTALIAGCGSRREALAQARPLRKLFAQLGPFFTGHLSPAQATLPPIVYVGGVTPMIANRHRTGARLAGRTRPVFASGKLSEARSQ